MASPIQSITNALTAYANAAKSGTVEQDPQTIPPASSFADLVKGAAESATEMGIKAENLTMSAVNDQTDLNQVITAVAEAELTLQTVVAIRDKVIDAYREILRMPI